MAKLTNETKSRFKRFKAWQERQDQPAIEDLKALDQDFQQAVILFYQTGNIDQIKYISDCHLGKNKEKFVEYLIDRLPFEYKGDDRASFKVRANWKDSFYTTVIKSLNPFTTIRFSRPRTDVTGNIRLEKEFSNLDELHSFILDCLVLYRKSFSREQVSQLEEMITKISRNT